MDSELKLLPCPFCGGESEMVGGEQDEFCHWHVQCIVCGAISGESLSTSTPDRDFASESWNRRPTPAPGELPELPLLQFAVFDEFGKGADDRVQDYGSLCYERGYAAASLLRAYARAYAEQCRAGVVVTDAMVERGAVAFCATFGVEWSGLHQHERESYRKKIRAALQSAFADDEGVR